MATLVLDVFVPEVVTSHLEEEVAKGILRAPFLPRLLRISKFPLLALFLKKTFRQISDYIPSVLPQIREFQPKTFY